jgi:uncharacterized protein YkwD
MRLAAIGDATTDGIAVDRDRITVGAADGNDLVIEAPTVSRRHATIERQAGAWRIVDHNSTNGTYVNGVRVNGGAPIKPGDELRFGGARYTLVAAPPPRPRRRLLAYSALVALVFVAGFGIAEYVINWSRLEGAGTSVAPSSQASSVGYVPAPSVVPPSAEATAASWPSSAATSAAVSTAVVSATPVAPATRTASVAPAAPSAEAHPAWLDALNHYRTMSGLGPVANDIETSRGDEAHARYLIENYKDSIRHGIGSGALMHKEDPGNRWYTPAGARAANSSDVAEWPGPHPPPSPLWEFDGWMSGPFHRLSILNPQLRTASLGSWCDGAVCAVALNVVAGAAETVLGTAIPQAVRFPAPNTTLDMNSSQGEWPDPLDSCTGYVAPSGLPITLQVALFHAVRLDNFSLKLDGPTPVPIEACGIDGATYVSPDPEAQRRGRATLTAFGAVIVVPRAPLAPGRYTVAITADGEPYSWSFVIAPGVDAGG